MSSHDSTPQLVGAARLFWMMLGPGILVLLALSILNRGNGWFTPHDLAYVAVLGLLLLARWYEFHEGHAQTASGDPATQAHLKRYLLVATSLGLTLWAFVNLIGNHWLAV